MSEAKQAALQLIQDARNAWACGDTKRSLEILGKAEAALVSCGESAETMPGIFSGIEDVRGLLIAASNR